MVFNKEKWMLLLLYVNPGDEAAKERPYSNIQHRLFKS